MNAINTPILEFLKDTIDHVRCRNFLMAALPGAGIATVCDLLQRSIPEIEALPGVGGSTIWNLKRALAVRNWYLRDDPENPANQPPPAPPAPRRSLEEMIRERIRRKAWDRLNSQDCETPSEQAVEDETDDMMAGLALVLANLMEE